MKTMTERSYRGESDLQAIADMLNACEAVDREDEGTSVSELRSAFDNPYLDKELDLRLWEDNNGLVGFGQTWIPESGEVIDGFLWFRVHPNARGGGLETHIIAWAEERMRAVGQERCLPVKLQTESRADRAAFVEILEKHGFKSDRHFFTMSRSLAEPIAKSLLPQGYTLRQVNPEQDAEAWVEMHNQSFIDHWNHHELTVDRLKYRWQKPNYRPDLDWIAIAPDGTFAAYCNCNIYPEENTRNGTNEGWVNILGTRRGFRRMGLGRAMLLAGLHHLKGSGVDTAKLGVDTENPSGALQLYKSVGFRQLYTRIVFVKDL
jgi:mycothiol synthase